MMFGWFEKKRLVRTYDASITLPGQFNIGTIKGKCYYHLFETKFGKRSVEFEWTVIPQNGENKKDIMTKSEFYQERIYRWLKGRDDPDIPKYSQVPEDDTVNYLKGKV